MPAAKPTQVKVKGGPSGVKASPPRSPMASPSPKPTRPPAKAAGFAPMTVAPPGTPPDTGGPAMGPAATGYPAPAVTGENEQPLPTKQEMDIRLSQQNNQDTRKSKGDLVAALLFALVIVNGFSAGHFKNIIGSLTNNHPDPKSTHTDFLVLMGELVFVVGVSMFAQVSDGAANFTLSLTIGLWLVWGVQNGKSIASFAKKVNPNG